MAQRKTEIWLTSVLEDGLVTNAVVLAESLRKTRTTRTVGVITSRNVSMEKRIQLREAFDAVFYMDESYFPIKGLCAEMEDVQAKLFVFSMHFFKKCIYISPNSFVLENMDKLFEDDVQFKGIINVEDGSIDFNLFMISPNRAMWQSLLANICHNGNVLSENYLRNWLKNQRGAMKMNVIKEYVLAKFSLKTGTLMTNQTHAPIIQFVDAQNDQSFAARLEELKNLTTGLPEQLINSTWLESYGDMLELINNPAPSRSHPSIASNCSYEGNEPIAIVGMSCRYPGANTLDEFWNMLYKGEEGVREPPAFRWTKEHSLRVTQQERKTNAGFLSTSVDEFDARFFGVSPKEAAYMDPQARLLHEVVWESLEDGGIDPLSLYGTHTGIFTGSWMNDYRDIVQGSTERDFFRTYMGNSIGAAAARLSFLLGLTGPSIATESGCSSAIVALDLAVKSLRSGESNLAVAGGVNLLLHPFTSNIMDYVIAPNGRCKTFDSKADGFGRAEGCGVLVLKRMSDALRDRDNIWALVRGSAVSQEGLSRSLGTPTVHCEALAMQLALEDAHVKPSQVSFVETHGTGTAVGDPMEVAAIAKAYYSPDRKDPLVIGSVKTNVGHTESCSGITGIMKTVLAMHHELIPKHRNLETLNPEIFLDSIPATIPLENIPWPKVEGQPRIAGVSSFGITGTDGHVIVEEAPDYQLPKFTLGLERPTHIIKISVKTSEALEELLIKYQNLFSKKINFNDDSFANVAFSANVGRATFNHRTFIVANNYPDAITAIQTQPILRGEVKEGETRHICFLFTGQGSQYQGMAKTLYETSPIFRVNFDVCDRTLREMYNLSIRQVLWESDPSSKELSRTIYSQTSIFCIEFCLLKLWESWGITPDYVLGHSLGEFAAAVAAGILDFKDALKLVAERSRLIDSLPRGSMLVVKASKPEVEKLMRSGQFDLDFAAVNNPEQTVVAGDTQKIELFLAFLKGQGQKAIILEATHAFHSRHMDPMLEQYRKIAKTINYKMGNCNVQYISGMEGRLICDSSELNADYWVRHTREKVNFVDACATLREANIQEYLEVGPQPVLSSFVMMNNEDVQMTCLPSLRRGTDDWNTILNSLGKLYLLGYKVDWKGFDDTYIRNKVSLPFHPFHRKPFWVECNTSNVTLIHPLIGFSLNNASNLNIFQNDLSIKSVPYLKDHCIGTRMIFPGAGYTEMCLSAGYCVANGLTDSMEPPRRALKLEELRIDAPLELKEGKGCRFQVIVDLPDTLASKELDTTVQNQGFRVKVFHQNTSSEDSDKWVLHASSTFIPVASTKDALKKWNPERVKNIMSSVQPTSSDAFYKRVDDTGLKFGETFRQIQRHWNVKINGTNADEVVAEIPLPEDFNKYLLHPLLIDAAFQSGILTGLKYDQFTRLKVPIRIGSLTLLNAIERKTNDERSIPTKVYIHFWTEHEKYYGFILSEDFVPIAYLDDVELIDTNVRTIESVLEQQNSSIPDAWEEVWRTIPGPFTNAIDLTSMKESFSQIDIQKELSVLSETSPEKMEIFVKTNRLMYLYTINALYDLGWQPELNEGWSVQDFCEKFKILPKFQQMLHFYFTLFHDEDNVMEYNEKTKLWKVTCMPPTQAKVKVEVENLSLQLKNIDATTTVVNIYEHVASLLVNILKGEESALSILFPIDEDKQQYSADRYYQNYPGRENLMSISQRTVLFINKHQQTLNSSHPNRVCRVLEVGSGTGSMTQHTILALREAWGDKFEYYYTDISQSFFMKAEKKFEEYAGNMKFAVFNLEESPLEQGIPLNYFDMVLGTDVLHATRNLQESLVHIRQTMRPNATLFFTETIITAKDITYVFGLLEGYWRFEDFQLRPHHTCVDEETWGHVLRESGFNPLNTTECYAGTFGCISAEASDQTEVTSLMAKGVPTQTDNQKGWVIFCAGADSTTLHVTNMLNACGVKVTVVLKSCEGISTINQTAKLLRPGISIATVQTDDGDIMDTVLKRDCINGILYAWGKDTATIDQKHVALPFMNIAKWALVQKKPPSIFLLTQGVHSINESVTSNPTSATLFGMAKSLKNENAELFVRYIDLESMISDSKILADQILYELVMSKGFKEAGRLQVAYRDNLRYEPRCVKANVATKHDELQLPPSSDRYHLVLPKTRLIQDLEFDSLEVEEVKENEVEIKIKAFALNFKDILTILKPSAEFEQLNTVGLDFSGVVSKVGTKVEAYKVGDRVFGANFKEAQLPSHLVLDADSLLCIPDKMTFWEAATLPAVFATAYHCLISIAKMKKGDTVLIHTGSGGVGLAAIQLAKHVGATIITTAGNPRKRAYLKNIGVEHVFHSRNTSYEKEIMRVTHGKGVDVVLNSITGPGLKEATLASCGKNARFVEMSKLSIWTPEEVKDLRPDVDYSIVDLTVLDKEAWGKLLKNLTEYLERGYITAIPYVKYDALMIRQALQFFQKAKHIGKVVCAMPEVVTQDGVFKSQVRLFNDESTYLITGGLGGIGFEVCRWMLEKGATDIVLTARSPPKPEIAATIDYLNTKKGFNIIVRQGDVSDYQQVKQIIDDIGKTGKPLRGVMHCAGVLRDNLYANQTWDSFDATFKPKVEGTWHLHNLTKDMHLEHFVFFSSIIAMMGTPSQPNHSAANCFEDAFAHYRHSMGLPATTINWGQWAQVGCAKEITVTGILPVSVKRMMNGLEVAMKTQRLQICFSEFESFKSLSILIPLTKCYLDDKMWKQVEGGNQAANVLNPDKFWGEMDAIDEKTEKVELVGNYLKMILRASLRLDAGEPISEDANIQVLGVDSLMLIELKNSIQSLLGSRISVTASLLKNCNTVRQLATAIVERIMEDGEDAVPEEPLSIEELSQLLQMDCQLEDSIRITNEASEVTKPSNIRTVLVTGATGQLGASLLAEVSNKYTNVTKLICLVREKAGVPLEKRVTECLKSMDLTNLVDMSKIECVAGDVTEPCLGIDQKTYDRLAESVDAVIHCAGKSNFSEHYRKCESGKNTDVRSVHVEGTINVLKFAQDQKIKQVYFASTFICGIFGENDHGTLPDDWPGKDVIKAIIDAKIPGLQMSKFVCELLIKEANLRGIPCKVFRFPWIAGHSQTGRVDYLNNMYIVRYLSFLKMNAMPSLPLPANVLPIDLCAQLSLNLFFNDEAPFEIFNVGHPQPQMEQEFLKVAKEEMGKELEILEWQEFSERLKQNDTQIDSLKDLYKDQKSTSMYIADALGMLKGYLVSPETFFANEKVSRFIPDFEKRMPPSMEIVRRDLRYLKSTGFLEKFGI